MVTSRRSPCAVPGRPGSSARSEMQEASRPRVAQTQKKGRRRMVDALMSFFRLMVLFQVLVCFIGLFLVRRDGRKGWAGRTIPSCKQMKEVYARRWSGHIPLPGLRRSGRTAEFPRRGLFFPRLGGIRSPRGWNPRSGQSVFAARAGNFCSPPGEFLPPAQGVFTACAGSFRYPGRQFRASRQAVRRSVRFISRRLPDE